MSEKKETRKKEKFVLNQQADSNSPVLPTWQEQADEEMNTDYYSKVIMLKLLEEKRKKETDE